MRRWVHALTMLGVCVFAACRSSQLVKRTPYGQFPMKKKAFYEVVKSGVFGQMGLHSSDLFKLQ